MRLIDADALKAKWYDINNITEEDRGARFVGYQEIAKLIDNALTVDAVQVVRCKDCKHRREICPMRYIEMVGEDERIHDYSTDNGYCSWGERREDGDDE